MVKVSFVAAVRKAWYRRKTIFALIAIVSFAWLLGFTDFFGKSVHAEVSASFKKYFGGFLPQTASIFVAVVALLIFSMSYGPLKDAFVRILVRKNITNERQLSFLRMGRFFYWLLVGVFIISLVLPNLLTLVIGSATVIGVGIGVNMKDIVLDLAAGRLLMLFPQDKCNVGDVVEIPDVKAIGRVTRIDLFVVKLRDDAGNEYNVPNQLVWTKVIVRHPPGSPALAPTATPVQPPVVPPAAVIAHQVAPPPVVTPLAPPSTAAVPSAPAAVVSTPSPAPQPQLPAQNSTVAPTAVQPADGAAKVDHGPNLNEQ